MISDFTPEFSAEKKPEYQIDLFKDIDKKRDAAIASSSAFVIKTILPKLADINFTTNIEILKKISNYLTVIEDIEKEVEISLNYYSALQKCDSTTALSEFYKDLENNKLKTLDNDFVDFWTKRYQLTVEPLKTIIATSLNITLDSFFSDFSDSIGLLVNSNCLLDDNVIPFIDYTCNLYKAPNTIPVQLRNKISRSTAYISTQLSTNNTVLMRNNLKNINIVSVDVNPYTNPTTIPAHGTNLITDINTYQIIKNNLSSFYERLKNSYKKTFSYIEYLSNIRDLDGYNPRDLSVSNGTNQQLINNLYFSFNVEKFSQNLDLLQNKIKNLLSYKTNKNTLSNNTTDNIA